MFSHTMQLASVTSESLEIQAADPQSDQFQVSVQLIRVAELAYSQ
jgi:hypothetical protein